MAEYTIIYFFYHKLYVNKDSILNWVYEKNCNIKVLQFQIDLVS